MKKILYLIAVVGFCMSCSDTVEFNNPAIQADNEGDLWKAVVQTAATRDGGLIIEGGRGTEQLLLFTSRTDAGVYPLGGNNVSEARFTDANGIVYSTLNTPDPSVQVFPAAGQIEIMSVDLTANIATGEFWFNAFTEDGLNAINFINGVFFEVPIRQNITETTGGTTCDAATTEVNLALEQLEVRTPDITLCNAYEAALQTQLLACGDLDGAIQAELDRLDCNDEDNDGVPNSFEDLNMDGNLDNDDTDGDSIPNYLDPDDDGDGVPTADESGDTDGDSIPNYLDPDDDGDSVLTIYEDPTLPRDTDGDSIPDYLDNDDDGDGIETSDENPDPNGDGNPNDAVDTDMNGIPDYLQA